MLLPRYSIKRMFWMTALLAIFFAIVSRAVQGDVWAIALSTAIGSLGLMLVVQSAVFGVVWTTSQVLRSLNIDTRAISRPEHGTPLARETHPQDLH